MDLADLEQHQPSPGPVRRAQMGPRFVSLEPGPGRAQACTVTSPSLLSEADPPSLPLLSLFRSLCPLPLSLPAWRRTSDIASRFAGSAQSSSSLRWYCITIGGADEPGTLGSLRTSNQRVCGCLQGAALAFCRNPHHSTWV